jgi:hypothetical protein
MEASARLRQRFVPHGEGAAPANSGELVDTGTVNYTRFLDDILEASSSSSGGGDGARSSSVNEDVSTLGALYAHVGLRMDQMQEIFSAMDTNGDGLISAAEFRQAWSRMEVRRHAAHIQILLCLPCLSSVSLLLMSLCVSVSCVCLCACVWACVCLLVCCVGRGALY